MIQKYNWFLILIWCGSYLNTFTYWFKKSLYSFSYTIMPSTNNDSFFIQSLNIFFFLSITHETGYYFSQWLIQVVILGAFGLILSYRKMDFNILPLGMICCSGLSRWLSGKESPWECRRCRFNPWIGKSPWRRNWQPTLVFWPGKSHGQEEPDRLQSMRSQKSRTWLGN